MEIKKATDYPQIECNEFWVTKMRTVFRRLDYTGTGVVLLDDLLDIATQLMDVFPKMETFKGDEMVNAMVEFWFYYLCFHLEANQRVSGVINEHTFVTNIKSHINEGLKTNFEEILVKPFFHAADDDDDGKITALQFKNVMKSWKGIENDANLIFRLLDTDKDGKITLDEFHHAMAEYFYCTDKKTSKLTNLWGHLVSYKRPEDYGEVSCGPFWEGKIRNMFRRMDVSGKGKLKCKDFIKIARGIIQRGRLDKKKADAVTHSMLNIWIKYLAIGPDGEHHYEISEKEFVTNMRNMINGPFRHEIDQFGWTFFKAVEVDGNGQISLQEYRNLQESWNVGREEAEALFRIIDTDKDHLISSDEYLTAWMDYLLGEDTNSQYRGFFGTTIVRHDCR